MKLLERLGIVPRDASLYEAAFTHKSYVNEHGGTSYERLEYLGDAILEFIISDYLYNHTNCNEGTMTKIRSQYVCENALYRYSIRWKLNELLKLGQGEEESGSRYRKTIVADIYEAFVGALYLDQGIEKAKKFVYLTAVPSIKAKEFDFSVDCKSKLQELVQTDRRSLEYKIIKEEGPDHNRTFTAIVKINGIVCGKGSAHSKKEAEQAAAQSALKINTTR